MTQEIASPTKYSKLQPDGNIINMNDTLLTILTVIVGSSLLAALASNWQVSRLKRKAMIADAIQSALKRVEMYYRVRRRNPDKSDDIQLRDRFHQIQEDNDHHTALLEMESPWAGYAYRKFLDALKRTLAPHMKKAWENPGSGPNVQLQAEDRPNVDRYVRLFTRDGRRLMNPFMRPVMRVHYWLRKLLKENPYDAN